MAHEALLAPLRGVALFQGLRPLQITEIARRSERIIFRPGDVIVRSDEVGDAAYLIASPGAVRTAGPDLGDAPPEPVPAGALVAEMAMLIDDSEHTSTVVATDTVRALRIPRATMLALMAEDPDIAEHFVAKITARLGALRSEIKQIDAMLAGSQTDAAASARPELRH
jgi:CRP-like cAMP-binding protein